MNKMENVSISYWDDIMTTISDNFTTERANITGNPDVNLFTYSEGIILAVFVGLFSAFGIFANAVTFFVIARSDKLKKSPFNIMLMSLCVSDFLSACYSPFVLYRRTFGYSKYSLPVFFCKIVALGIWVETFLANFVFYFWFPTVLPSNLVTFRKACTSQLAKLIVLRRYMLFAFPIFLYFPICAVALLSFYLVILVATRRKSIKDNRSNTDVKKENFALLQLSFILASFLLGYLPDIVYRIMAISWPRLYGKGYHGRVPWQHSMAAHMLLRISECLNPIFYNLASSAMRAETRTVLKRLFRKEETKIQRSTDVDTHTKESSKQQTTV
uniref:uncharacterized protein LOC120329995 isoform X2 n=1 Tax=Styela clava TaxID=7725 RepID=UPI001939CEB6|nr:uncharacterized protein LOC120329995 isoform X2 [Styela clava]